MASEKRLYLMAAVVFAFGFGNSLITKHMDWIDSLSDRVDGVVSRVSDNASEGDTRFESLAQRTFGRGEKGMERGSMALDRVQAKLVCMQARMAQRQAEMARIQADRGQVEIRNQMQRDFRQQQKNEIKAPKLRTIPNGDTI
jgi:hypothetical protein